MTDEAEMSLDTLIDDLWATGKIDLDAFKAIKEKLEKPDPVYMFTFHRKPMRRNYYGSYERDLTFEVIAGNEKEASEKAIAISDVSHANYNYVLISVKELRG